MPGDPTASSPVTDRLQAARQELLDLSNRNRLLNTPRPPARSRSIEIVDERSDEVFRILVRERKGMTFQAVPESAGTGETADTGEIPMTAETAGTARTAETGDTAEIPKTAGGASSPEHEEPGEPVEPDPEGGLPQPEPAPSSVPAGGGLAGAPPAASSAEAPLEKRHTDRGLQTRLTSKGLQKRLLDMYYDARTYFEEQGANILFLALGILRWKEAETGRAFDAPLLLVPVSLHRESALERFRLRWLEEDISSNLSLLARMDGEFGLELPDVPDMEDIVPSAYFDEVASKCAGMPGWEVLRNDIVLGFFSFAKFLMYRDLDPENWPEDDRIDRHPLIASTLGDGFPPDAGFLDDRESIDARIPPEEVLHVLDADGSQTVAIEEVKRGSHLVIQGPPGTGKSQTIANLMAAALLRGKRVLFVAEKLAALEVVKRRLDAIGLGGACLELHSNKTSKRAVLEELRRTLDIGTRRHEGAGDLPSRIGKAQEVLNRHPEILHAPIEPSDLSPYEVMARLVRLSRRGLPPADFNLPAGVGWSPAEVSERVEIVEALAERARAIGTPARHAWRGAGIDAVLPMDLERLDARMGGIEPRLRRLIRASAQLEGILRRDAPVTLTGSASLVEAAGRIAAAPELDAPAITDAAWRDSGEDVERLVSRGETLAARRLELAGVLREDAWAAPAEAVLLARRDLAAHGGSWLRFLRKAYREAVETLRGMTAADPPRGLRARIGLLDSLIEARDAREGLRAGDDLGRRAFGRLWRGEESDWVALREIVSWEKENRVSGLAERLKEILERPGGIQAVIDLAREIDELRGEAARELQALFGELRLDLEAAFGAGRLEDLDLPAAAERLDAWRSGGEGLSHWIGYRRILEGCRAAGLAAIAERVHDGRVEPDLAADHFHRAHLEALIRKAFETRPELAAFDGKSHERVIEEFRRLDGRRIEAARTMAATAHAGSIPRGAAAIGGLGLLQREIEKKRRHLPIRQLMKAAGGAIQAIKPVFMMSPLSIAQFLEPGSITFDLLLMDEASQVEPVDAFGAFARARQAVVVGDDRQLPPTRFFSKLLEETPAAGDAAEVHAGDIESILGLCIAQGMRQKMLRWHYRSRHPSLIAVSNREFYEGKLHIVPSPLPQEPDAGLKLHRILDAVYDRGGAATNVVEARAVASAVIEHARRRPDWTLGVGTFSLGQRQAILGELERLWRAHPDVQDFFSAASPEPFFVKNLENIQGDERDVIFISVGYARDGEGRLSMNFGPVSIEGGERRLNVLITRARRACEVFSSITDEDIDLERARGRGVAALKTFLRYARTGSLAAGGEPAASSKPPLEEEVARALEEQGFRVETRLGVSGFFIDIAVLDPDRQGRYVLGIDCDGPGYREFRSARDRDRLRRAILEDHGWILHRIWSADWFQRPREETKRAVAAIEAARNEWARRHAAAASPAPRAAEPPRAEGPGPEGEAAPPGGRPAAEEGGPEPRREAGSAADGPRTIAVPYVEADFPVALDGEPHEAPSSVLEEIVERIIAIEGPVHEEEVARRVATLLGLKRAGSRVSRRVEEALEAAARAGAIAREGPFCSKARAGETPVRSREHVASSTLRKAEMLAPAEVRAAAIAVVRAHFGARRDETVGEVARVLGFKAAGERLRTLIEREVQALIDAGGLKVRDGRLEPPPPKEVSKGV